MCPIKGCQMCLSQQAWKWLHYNAYVELIANEGCCDGPSLTPRDRIAFVTSSASNGSLNCLLWLRSWQPCENEIRQPRHSSSHSSAAHSPGWACACSRRAMATAQSQEAWP